MDAWNHVSTYWGQLANTIVLCGGGDACCRCHYCSDLCVACAGVYISLKPIVLVDLLGLEKLSSAFGLALLFQGIGALAGPPLAGLSIQPRSARI